MRVTMTVLRALKGLLVAAVVASTAVLPAHAQLKIEITNGVTDPVPIAVVQFARAVPVDGGLDVAGVIQHDLAGSGRFRALSGPRLPTSTPTRADDVVAAEWKNAGADYVVVGRVTSIDAGQVAVDFDLVNSLTGQRVVTQRFVGVPSALRNAAHRVSDVVYEKILGIRGAFATRIAYIAVDGEPPAQNYQLIVADADGENQRLILQSRFPLMSPSWSPDGQWLSYVSFESKRSACTCSLSARESAARFRRVRVSMEPPPGRPTGRSWRSPWAVVTATPTFTCSTSRHRTCHASRTILRSTRSRPGRRMATLFTSRRTARAARRSTV